MTPSPEPEDLIEMTPRRVGVAFREGRNAVFESRAARRFQKFSGMSSSIALARWGSRGLFVAVLLSTLTDAAAQSTEPNEPSQRDEPSEEESSSRRQPAPPDGGGLEQSGAAVEATTVEVRGTRPHPTRPPAEPGVAGSTVGTERLVQPGGGVADALREVPGVQVTQTGGLGAPSTARLRGATAAQTPVYLGGIRINDEVGGVADLSLVPPDLIERVEIYRSHAPGDARQLGIGGALFLVPLRTGSSETSLGTTFGSFGTRQGRARSSVREGQRFVTAYASLRAADNDYEYFDTRGTLFVDDDGGPASLPNADSEQLDVWLLAGDQLGPVQLSFLFNHAQREQGAPKLALVPSDQARVEFGRTLFGITAEMPVEGWAGSVSLSTQATMAQTTVDDPAQELGLLTVRTASPGERISQELQTKQRLGRRWELSQQLSLNIDRQRRIESVESRDKTALAARRFSGRAAVGADWNPWRGLHLDGVLAVQCFDTSAAGLEACVQTEPTGRAGLRYELPKWDVYASAGRYFRLPTLSELYGQGILVRGNEALRPERGTTAEAGARYQWARPGRAPLFWVDVAGFVRWSTDLVAYVRTAQGFLHPANRDQARTVGGELAVGVSPAPDLKLEGQFSLIDPRDTTEERRFSNDVLPFLSRATASARAEYVWEFGRGELDRLSTGLRFIYQSSRFADPAGLGVIPGQSAIDWEAAATLFDERLVLRGRVSNVLDQFRYDVVGFPLPGRSVFVSLDVTW